MNWNIKILARVAVFAALAFVFAYFSTWIYNVNLGFFIIFLAGFLWGFAPGIITALVAYFLFSVFNPLGPPALPVLLAQLAGASLTAIIGTLSVKPIMNTKGLKKYLILALAGILSGLTFHIIVDVADAWVFQPFWPRLIGGLLFSLITIVSNAIIFPLLYPAVAFMHKQERPD